MVEHRLNFIRMMHTDNAAAVEESLTENKSDSPPSTTPTPSISDLEEMMEFTQGAKLEDTALLIKAEIHLDQVETAVAIHHHVKQQHNQGRPMVYDPAIDLEDGIQVYDKFKGEYAAFNGKFLSFPD